MKRRTLDVVFSVGGLGLAALLLVLGLVMTSNASFAHGYVKDQLGEQHVAFPARGTLTAEEAQSACLVRYAGKALTTGKQAECYANDFIALHLRAIAGGRTYADLGAPQSALKAQLAAAEAAGDPAASGLQTQLAALSAQRESLFTGETLRGLLLTSFGFSVFGVKGGQVATVAYLVAALLALLSLAGLYHASRTPRTEAFAPAEPTPTPTVATAGA
jgi:hypothetical protein